MNGLLTIHNLPEGRFRLSDSVGVPETVDFDSYEEASAEKCRRFIFKGAIGLKGSETYQGLNERISSAVKERLLTKDSSGYANGWVRDFDSKHVYYTNADKVYAVEWSDDKEKGITLGVPVQVTTKTVYEKTFSLGAFSEFAKDKAKPEMVTKIGKIFEAGDYPDKGISVSEEELQAMVDGFTAVPNDLEHMDTVLDGKLGHLNEVWRTGKELFGSVSVPSWLAGAVEDSPVKVSIALNRNKKIVGNALVLNPRVTDACIMRAFSSEKESRNPGKKGMKIKDFLAVFGLGGVTSVDDDVPEGVKLPSAFGTPLAPAIDPKTAALEVELATFRAAEKTRKSGAVEEAAKAFAKNLIEAGAILPNAHEEVMTLYKSALISDGEAGEIKFSDAGAIVEGANVAALKKVLSEKAPVGPGSTGALLFNAAPGSAESIEAGAKDILNSTQFGRQAAKSGGAV